LIDDLDLRRATLVPVDERDRWMQDSGRQDIADRGRVDASIHGRTSKSGGGVWDDFRNWVSLAFQPAKGDETRQ
jgi:hypothetical protein